MRRVLFIFVFSLVFFYDGTLFVYLRKYEEGLSFFLPPGSMANRVSLLGFWGPRTPQLVLMQRCGVTKGDPFWWVQGGLNRTLSCCPLCPGALCSPQSV